MKLQSIQLDFAPTTFLSSRRSSLLLVAGSLAIILAIGAYIFAASLAHESRATKLTLEKKLGLVSSLAANASGRSSALSTSSIADEIGRQWFRLLGDLEEGISDDVMLLRVEPNPKTREVVLVGECANVDNIASFIQRLNRTQVIRNARMTAQRTLENTADGRLEFTIVATWVEAR